LLLGYSVLLEFDYSRVSSRTFIHWSAQHINSKL
jgi:hypothetical protein